MKKLLFLLTGLLFTSCSVDETVQAQLEFEGVIYRIAHYEKETPKSELETFVSNTASADKTTYYFYYPKDVDVSVFTEEKFSKGDFYQTVIDSNPTFGFYKMPTDAKVYDDGIWLISQHAK